MLYMATFTINIPPMLAYIPYIDPMGILYTYIHTYIYIFPCHMIIICDRRCAPRNLVYIRENSKDDLLDMFIQNQRMRIRNCICYDTHLRISSDTCVALLHLFLWNKERCTSLFIIMFTQQFHQMDPMFRG